MTSHLVQEGWVRNGQFDCTDELGGHVFWFVNVVRDVRLASEQAEPAIEFEQSSRAQVVWIQVSERDESGRAAQECSPRWVG